MGHECHEVASGLGQRVVAVRVAEPGTLGQVEPADPGVAEGCDDACGVVRAAIADHEELEVRDRLLEDRADGEPDHVRAVMGRQQDAETRRPRTPIGGHRAHQPGVPSNETGMSGVSSGNRYLSGFA